MFSFSESLDSLLEDSKGWDDDWDWELVTWGIATVDLSEVETVDMV